jgi:hypothetical protein
VASPSDDAERAALALRRGDPLAALSLASRAGGALGLAIRGAALAQLEEGEEAERCLREAARLARAAADVQTAARVELALVEIALARRDLAAARKGLGACEGAFARDPANAVFVAVLRARLELLQRRPGAARALLAESRGSVDAFSSAIVRLCRAEIALAEGDVAACTAELREAQEAADRSRHGFLLAEIEAGESRLRAPAAHIVRGDTRRAVDLLELAALRVTDDGVVVDSMRRRLRAHGREIDLSRRPLLFRLLEQLAAHAPGAVPSAELVASFGARRVNASHLANLRVEIGRLRRLLPKTLGLESTGGAFRLKSGDDIVIVEPLERGEAADVEALLSDGQTWRTDEVAQALGLAKRTAQRKLGLLARSGRVVAMGEARTRRYRIASEETFTLLGQLSLLWGGGV